MNYSIENVCIFVNNSGQVVGVVRPISGRQFGVGLTQRLYESIDHLRSVFWKRRYFSVKNERYQYILLVGLKHYMTDGHWRCGQRYLKEVERSVVVLQSGIYDTAVVVIEQKIFNIIVVVLKYRQVTITHCSILQLTLLSLLLCWCL